MGPWAQASGRAGVCWFGRSGRSGVQIGRAGGSGGSILIYVLYIFMISDEANAGHAYWNLQKHALVHLSIQL